MIRPLAAAHAPITVNILAPGALDARIDALWKFIQASDRPVPLSHHPAWLRILRDALCHGVYGLEAQIAGHTCGFLPVACVRSLIFGNYLVSLPYLNTNGVLAEASEVRTRLISRACTLADELDVRHLELRHEVAVDHPRLNAAMTSKVHMRKTLPGTAELLWRGLDAKVRNQIRKAEKCDLSMAWGLQQILPFYEVLSRNMRDLGTPVYGRVLFEKILEQFPRHAELGVAYLERRPVAACLLLHGRGITEIPTASSLREFNSTCANMWMYHQALVRSVERGQVLFDFGRSTIDGPTFKFKKQWGAVACPAVWQYYSRNGGISEMRPDNPRYERVIRLWQKLPVRLTQLLGPPIMRWIP